MFHPAQVRRQYAESWRKVLELRAQIQAQLKLADTLKKISEAAGTSGRTWRNREISEATGAGK